MYLVINNYNHVIVIYDVVKNSNDIVTKIKYAHSASKTGKADDPEYGPEYGYITIGDENQDLNGKSQTFHDSSTSFATLLKNGYKHTVLLTALQ